MGIIIAGLVSVNEAEFYSRYKEAKGKENGINSELEYLKKQIVLEKQKLEELKKDKSRDKEDKRFRIVKVDDKPRLDILQSRLKLYYDLGYNGKKYYKYLLKRKLDKKLKKYYNEEEIELAKEYLEEKGPTLVKKIK